MKFTAQKSYIDGMSSKGDVNSEFDFVVPAFIDIHCHGGGGKYFSEDYRIAQESHHNFGTAVQMASLVTQEISALKSQIENLKESELFGIHLEGPYLSSKFCGAHDPALLRTPNLSEVKELIALGEGAIKMVTIAPELSGAIEVIEYLTNHSVVVAIGHSAANASDTKKAISAGAKIVTHFNNAMAKLGAPDSLSEVALASDIYLELIQDGNHVSTQDSKTIFNEASERLVAVTDAMAAAGCADGEYKIGTLPVTVKNKVARLSGTETLAGSTLTMLDAFLNYEALFGFDAAVQFTSLNSAKIFNLNPYASYIGIKGKSVTHL
jgi:N-acetylglucosamine-6-phosphate deacetylase